MTNTTLGILAHVDAGKTTLAEAMLYTSGALRKAGRVDFGSSALDTHELERERGITIFSGQASFTSGDRRYTILDTPGHVDFSSATENAISCMDYGILVVSGAEGVQSHTRTLWRLLEIYAVPAVIFVTKMDYSHRTRQELTAELKREFGDGVVDLVNRTDSTDEEIAVCREDVLEKYVSGESVTDEDAASLIAGRCLFPVFFGSGLKMEGVREFIDALDAYTRPGVWPDAFGARVYKVAWEDGARVSYLKITGGGIAVRDEIASGDAKEKISQIRFYNGAKYVPADRAEAGDLCAVTGLSCARPGDGLGAQKSIDRVLEPVMSFALALPEGAAPDEAMRKLRSLEEEDPLLRLTWVAHLSEIHVSLLGRVQAEILKSVIAERFGYDVTIKSGGVLYKETIADTVEGVGHYEPLRHYAEVHLLLEPGARGSGIVAESKVGEDSLDRNWQRLILGHIKEKQHLGVLTGSPLTDVKITLASGRAHLKHTEGGDFRQATYRAVRQGLMKAKSVLLEPYYRFAIRLPTELTGRAITDVRERAGEFDNPESDGVYTTLRGRVPVATFAEYASDLAAYSSGRGSLSLEYAGYDLCHDPDAVISAAGYSPESDLANTPDSVFCAHGAGFNVSWRDVAQYMHLPSCLAKKAQPTAYGPRRFHIDDKELAEIMKREFGEVKYTLYKPASEKKKEKKEPDEIELRETRQTLIVDGYNCIFAWDELRALAEVSLEQARERLLEILSNYAAFTRADTVVVFDAYKVGGNTGEKFTRDNVHVVYTRERETGDAYIEKLVADIGKNEKVRVVTSDGLIQLSAVRFGVLRTSAAEFEKEVDAVYAQIEKYIEELNGGK